MRRTYVGAQLAVTLVLVFGIAGCPAPPAPPPSDDAGADSPMPVDAPVDSGRPVDAPDAPADPCADPDADGDGADSMACGGTDCDDADPNRAPGLSELCDAADLDEDCDSTTFGDRDVDGDTHVDVACCNGTTCGDDCDDARADVYGGLLETCDSRDNDCNGATDEGVDRVFTRDADGDGYGDALAGAATARGCTPPMGFVEDNTDCNDTVSTANPAASEFCDALAGSGVDHDCDGTANEGCTCVDGRVLACGDVDTFGDEALYGACDAGTRSCVGGIWRPCSVAPVPETCNDINDDCDSLTDEGVMRVTCYSDPDDDGYPGSMVTTGTRECPDLMARPMVAGCPVGMTNRAPVAGNIDCAPLNRNVRPGATAFRATPYCLDPATQLACLFSGSWFCVPTSAPTCFNSGVSASFDYDCDAVATRAPAQTCLTGGSACTGSCGTSGFDYTGSPACGSAADSVTCGGCDVGACGAPLTAPSSLGCR